MPEQNITQQKFNRLIESKNWFNQSDSAVVAVSAGVDSMALLNLMMHLPKKSRPKIIVAHVNHHLRAQSAEEEQYIRDFCQSHNVKIEVGNWEEQFHPSNGIEMAARKYRYDFFSKVVKDTNSRILLTAHHANDQAETVLMRLIRGSFVKDLVGIRESRKFNDGRLIRPLLGFSKEELTQYMQDLSIKWYEDDTNQKLDVTRNRIRHRLIPLIEAENNRGIEHVNDFSHQLNSMKKQNDFFFEKLAKDISVDTNTFELGAFLKLPKYVQSGLIDYLIDQEVVDGLNVDIVNQVTSLLNNDEKPQGVVELSNNLSIKKEYDKFLIENINQNQITGFKNDYFVVTLNKWYFEDDIQWMITDSSEVSYDGTRRVSRFNLLDSEFPLIVQKTQNHDRITLKNGGHQTAKRLFINKKIPVDKRQSANSLMTDQGRLLAILGYSESVSIDNSNARVYTLIIK
ncbi:tRNA lysidine(34) synthetase TilS [Apilactobacillus kunkeei]|uniref:tRNA lysidine(34) synthetase TilS n=1 Tax=Apilactobacillus kunkeei TaxID=148814 RepID=UPI00200B823E|nr:tRNA lysidine(34) synthetase TilS [Apilactobacillus kunkeei]MCK8629194.1 tRNA lysidine(34) synthetase TilS [Apilactobacillus kunkeei]CAI2568564.1 tRNA(Ile)-lysidine synthase [Apilactobacillus kunkeei]CAI2570904.1 tRNA(Ile)-lysidine synthase [Apilactobacillus kunkeei]